MVAGRRSLSLAVGECYKTTVVTVVAYSRSYARVCAVTSNDCNKCSFVANSLVFALFECSPPTFCLFVGDRRGVIST